MREVESSFQLDELAYLALTSKVEHPVRDRWSYKILRALADSEAIVSREWKRRDLAILVNGAPRAIVELKAMYTFDAAKDKDISGYATKLKYDMEKAEEHSRSNLANLEIFGVLLATHPDRQIDKKYDGVVKYLGGINRWVGEFSSQDLLKAAKKNVLCAMREHKMIAEGTYQGGSAFGASVSVHYWMFSQRLGCGEGQTASIHETTPTPSPS